MGSKQQAVEAAVDAGSVAAQAVNNYGINSPQAMGALIKANELADKAEAAGCTRADIDQARRR
jgi:hypothetical protein